jgi:hypothetical protein
MADYSKQWAELNDSEFPWDFDILEEFKRLEPNSYVNVICEGFGFDAIGNVGGQCMVSMPTDSTHFNWIPYETLLLM